MKSSLTKVSFLLAALLMFAGCTVVPAGQSVKAKADGGIWRSSDSGKKFQQANDVLATKGKALSISNVSITTMEFDPQDSMTIYAASLANGLFYSSDAGNSWQQFKDLKQGKVSAIAVDARNKCVVYATMDNKLFKTDNCGKDWNNIYFHQKSQTILTALALDPKTPATVYLGTSDGEILKSTDGGYAWLTAYRIERENIADIIIDPFDSNIIYAGTPKKGLYKTMDSGKTWNSLGAGLESYAGSHEYRKLVYDPAAANSLILVSKFGLLKTVDGGATWKVVDLLPAKKKVDILAVAVNPRNTNEFYYVTATTLVKTTDGGIKWSSLQLPYKRLTTDIKINPAAPNVVYLATRAVK